MFAASRVRPLYPRLKPRVDREPRGSVVRLAAACSETSDWSHKGVFLVGPCTEAWSNKENMTAT